MLDKHIDAGHGGKEQDIQKTIVRTVNGPRRSHPLLHALLHPSTAKWIGSKASAAHLLSHPLPSRSHRVSCNLHGPTANPELSPEVILWASDLGQVMGTEDGLDSWGLQCLCEPASQQVVEDLSGCHVDGAA